MSTLEDIFYKMWNFVPRADDSLHKLHARLPVRPVFKPEQVLFMLTGR